MEKVRLSSTAIDMFLRCPKKYEFRYVYGMEEELSEIALVGKEIHKIIEESEDLQRALEALDASEIIKGKYKSQARKSLIYVYSEFDIDRDLSLIEFDFRIEKENFTLTGIMDVVIVRKEEKIPIGIIDWKFSSRNPTFDKYLLQATVYYLAFKEVFGYTPRFVKFVNIQKKDYLNFSPDALEHSEKVLTDEILPFIIEMINSNKFPKLGMFTGSCRYCGFRKECLPGREYELPGVLRPKRN